MSSGVDAKPHIRFIFGYWRVSAVPVKWSRLSEESQSRFSKAHKAVSRENDRLQNERFKAAQQ